MVLRKQTDNLGSMSSFHYRYRYKYSSTDWIGVYFHRNFIKIVKTLIHKNFTLLDVYLYLEESNVTS